MRRFAVAVVELRGACLFSCVMCRGEGGKVGWTLVLVLKSLANVRVNRL